MSNIDFDALFEGRPQPPPLEHGEEMERPAGRGSGSPAAPDIGEIVALAAADHEFYCRHFFPKTFRQPSPPFHREVWELLEDQEHRRVGIEVFRGGAKTTILRAYTSKRVVYGVSRTILFVSASQEHSKKSLQWIRKQVEFNKVWARTYGVSRGKRWTDEVIEINHGVLGVTITILALGITGQTRGVNIDDYRPDLIVVDDPCDLENTATPEQRHKTEELFFGALDKSLTPSSENSDAKIVLLQTSLQQDDLINLCHRDPSWETRKFSILDEGGRSRWPERFPTVEIVNDKKAHIARNQLALWLREMECTATSEESAAFRPSWLRYWHELPEHMLTFMGVDPVPPPTNNDAARAELKGDFEVISVVGVFNGEYYVLETVGSRGHQPGWTISTIFALWHKWRPVRVRVEGVAYQRVLKWLLSQEMTKRRQFFQVNAVDDKRRKSHRILQAFSGIASEGRLHVNASQTEFVQQFCSFPHCGHDDYLDSVAMALDEALESGLDYLDESGQDAFIPAAKIKPSEWMVAP
jgi:predicted phage terminase large subunit-like protein